MTIKDVEERTGLSRSNVRFYEKEKLIEPSRNERNGYRDYSENDVENIKKIAYLRTLGISIEDIRSIISGKVTLQETLERQNEVLKSQITDLHKAKLMCEKMLDEESISYEKLQVEQYVTELHDYWKDNQIVFKLDSVSFFCIYGKYAYLDNDYRTMPDYWDFVLFPRKIFKKISTHLLTVLTMRVIVQTEQRKRNKKTGFRILSFHLLTTLETTSRVLMAAVKTAHKNFNLMFQHEGEMTYDDA